MSVLRPSAVVCVTGLVWRRSAARRSPGKCSKYTPQLSSTDWAMLPVLFDVSVVTTATKWLQGGGGGGGAELERPIDDKEREPPPGCIGFFCSERRVHAMTRGAGNRPVQGSRHASGLWRVGR